MYASCTHTDPTEIKKRAHVKAKNSTHARPDLRIENSEPARRDNPRRSDAQVNHT